MPTPKSILIFIQSLKGGGAERIAANLANAWAGQGRQVSLVTLDPQSTDVYGVDPRVDRYSLESPKATSESMIRNTIANFKRVFALRKVLRKVKPDVVLAVLPPGAVLAILAGVGLKSRVYVAEHTHPPNFPMDPVRELSRRLTYRRADGVIALTSTTAVWLTNEYGLNRVAVIPNAVTWPLPTAEPRVPLSQTTIGTRLFVIAAGRLTEEKQFALLIEAFSAVALNFPEWDLVILGEGPQGPLLTQLSTTLGIASRVHLPGWVGNVDDWYMRASVFVLTSRAEGFPSAMVEAMACGCPVVSFDCDTGPRDIVRNGTDGFLVSPQGGPAGLASALTLVMQDEVLRQSMSARATEVRDRFALPRILSDWEEVFQLAR